MQYKYLIFDFDGVLAETNSIRVEGFIELFHDYSPEQLGCFTDYLNKNGGLSRYAKIRYFFSDILQESISDESVREWALKYSEIVKEKVIQAPAVEGSIEFLENHRAIFSFAVVSGSDQSELRSVCQARRIAHYFDEILGSPVEKESNLVHLLADRQWRRGVCLYIGDSLNDYEASRKAGIDFVGRNSGLVNWRALGKVRYFDHFWQLDAILRPDTDKIVP